jgi:hypothetical protein
VLVRSRSWFVPCLLGLLVGAGASVGCHRKAEQAALNGDAVRKSLDGLKPQFAELKRRFMDLRERVESIPTNVPGFLDARARFYAAEESRGTTEAKVVWLTNRLDAALSSGNRDELQQISAEIVRSQEDIGKLDVLHTKMLHEMMAYQRMARQEEQAAAAEPPPAPPAKTKRSKSKP